MCRHSVDDKGYILQIGRFILCKAYCPKIDVGVHRVSSPDDIGGGAERIVISF